jgi:O-antigen/teichoic acid export membrane protein
MGLNFLFKIYLSYHISKEAIGLFWTCLDLISIGVMLFSGFKDSLVLAYDKANFHKIFYLYLLSFSLLSLCIALFEGVYFKFLHFQYPLYLLILLLFANLLAVFFSYLNTAYKNYRVMLFENLIATMSLLITFVLFHLFVSTIEALFYAFLFSYIAKVFYIIRFSKMQYKIEKSTFLEGKDFFKNTFYSGVMYFFSGFFISMSGVIIMDLFQDTSILAEYQVVVKSIFFSLVAVFVYPLNTFAFPQISKFIAEGRVSEVKRVEKTLSFYLLLFFIILLLGTFFTKYIIGFVFPIEYKKSYIMLNILLPFLPFIAYTTFAMNIIKGFDRFDFALYIRVAGSVFFFISIYLFYLLDFSAVCVVYSLDISFITMFLMALYFRRKVLL